MPFGIIGRTVPGMRQVVGFGDQSTRRGTFWGEFGARHCNQWGLTFAATWPSSQITLGRLVIVGQSSAHQTEVFRRLNNLTAPLTANSVGFCKLRRLTNRAQHLR